MQVETGMIAANLVSRTATVSRPAPEFTLAQRAARYGLTVLALVALSALFGTQVAAVLR
jgi:hypothetical protein